MKVPEDVAERGHLDFASGLNEETLGRGLKTEDRPVASAFFFSKPPRQVICLGGLPVTFAKNKSRAVSRTFLESLVLKTDFSRHESL